MTPLDETRQRNKYPGNCSVCKQFVEAGDGYLFKNTKYRSSKGYHVKCKDCFTGATAKRQKEEEKASRGKTLSVSFARKWCDALQIKTIEKSWGIYCEVYHDGSLILGWCDAFQGFQEYPTDDWCQEQGAKLKGYFTDAAIAYICTTLTELIQEKTAESDI